MKTQHIINALCAASLTTACLLSPSSAHAEFQSCDPAAIYPAAGTTDVPIDTHIHIQDSGCSTPLLLRVEDTYYDTTVVIQGNPSQTHAPTEPLLPNTDYILTAANVRGTFRTGDRVADVPSQAALEIKIFSHFVGERRSDDTVSHNVDVRVTSPEVVRDQVIVIELEGDIEDNHLPPSAFHLRVNPDEDYEVFSSGVFSKDEEQICVVATLRNVAGEIGASTRECIDAATAFEEPGPPGPMSSCSTVPGRTSSTTFLLLALAAALVSYRDRWSSRRYSSKW